ncbi:TPA: hypothetical protein DIV48_02230 [Candidatus Kaiserbacteria bacterium]|nr:MAG: hypothetical protein UY93_C0001G0037 [Parcubacteria group bacterium GW2011_GWA1_56_13]KKW46981.1 MAG: hypothetical protein UY97_C0001G0038 [Parcubacteria group bacterium GW2011_GWB1_57_6]HCR52445.1 hypothetical protein [Candidatus Kaiserbacteria bacterium]
MPRVEVVGFYVVVLVAFVAGNVLVYRTAFALPVLEVRVLDTDKDNAVLVRSPSGTTLLINAGKDAGILRELGSALPMWHRNIDSIVLTTVSADSSGGLPHIMERYRVSALVRPRAEGTRSQEAALAAAASAQRGLRHFTAERGQRFSLGDGAYADVLWPPNTASALNTADGAVVLRISYGSTSILIQNDLPPRAAAWLAVLNAGFPPPDLVISSSSTPASMYTSNGQMITKK